VYHYDRRAAGPEKDNSWGLGYFPLPPKLSGLGRFVENLKPTLLVSHNVFPREGIHMLTAHVNARLSVMGEDLKNLLRHGLVRIQCNEPGTLAFYFQDEPIPVAADTATPGPR
jgi:hypothetical protein